MGDRESGRQGGAAGSSGLDRLPLHAVEVLEGSYMAAEGRVEGEEQKLENISSKDGATSTAGSDAGFTSWSEERARREAEELRQEAATSKGTG